METLQVIWCILLVASIVTLSVPSRFINTECAYIHAGFVCWVVAALIGFMGLNEIAAWIFGGGFISILCCLMAKKVHVR